MNFRTRKLLRNRVPVRYIDGASRDRSTVRVFADDVPNGKDQFLMASKKAKDIKDAEFPEDASPASRAAPRLKIRTRRLQFR
jgi:hypothetical protein